MKRSNRLILLIGVFLAIVAFVGVVILFQGSGPTKTQEATELTTVYAAQDIKLGTIVTSEMVTTQNKKVTERDKSAFQDIGLVVGKTARRDIVKDAQITAADFAGGGAGLTTVTVPEGQRAIAVQVDQVSGVGTILRNGDYVDLLVGFAADKFPVVQLNPRDNTITVVSGLNATSVKLLLQSMQILGTLLPPRATTAQNQGAQASGEPTTTLNDQQQEIVILSVTPQQAEVIKYAQLDGSISLILRSAKEFQKLDENGNPIIPPPDETTGITLRLLVDEYKVLIPQLVEAVLPAQAGR